MIETARLALTRYDRPLFIGAILALLLALGWAYTGPRGPAGAWVAVTPPDASLACASYDGGPPVCWSAAAPGEPDAQVP